MTDAIDSNQMPPANRVSATPGHDGVTPIPVVGEALQRDAIFDDFAGGSGFGGGHDTPPHYYRSINLGYWLGALAVGGGIWTLVLTTW